MAARKKCVVAARQSSGWAQIVAVAASTIALGISAAVLWIVYYQVSLMRQQADRANARAAYMAYSQAALLFPEYAEPKLANIKKNPLKFVQYKSYVSYMLFAYDEILAVESDSPEWLASLKADLRDHAALLCQENRRDYYAMYDPRMREIIDDFKVLTCRTNAAPPATASIRKRR
jgi:hypothetical protein